MKRKGNLICLKTHPTQRSPAFRLPRTPAGGTDWIGFAGRPVKHLTRLILRVTIPASFAAFSLDDAKPIELLGWSNLTTSKRNVNRKLTRRLFHFPKQKWPFTSPRRPNTASRSGTIPEEEAARHDEAIEGDEATGRDLAALVFPMDSEGLWLGFRDRGKEITSDDVPVPQPQESSRKPARSVRPPQLGAQGGVLHSTQSMQKSHAS